MRVILLSGGIMFLFNNKKSIFLSFAFLGILIIFFQNCETSSFSINSNHSDTKGLGANNQANLNPVAYTLSSGFVTPVEDALCPVGWICPEQPILPKTTLVGAWYSLYFYEIGSNPVDHWSLEGFRYKPLLGRYNSADVIAQQYPLMKNAGINYLLLDDTNGVGNDGGQIQANAVKIFNSLPHDMPIAMAGGYGLWGKHSEQDQNTEAQHFWDHFGQKPNYLQWYNLESGSYKPLLVILNELESFYPNDEIKRYWKDSRFSVRYAAGYVNSLNPNLQEYAKQGLWGWATHSQVLSSETMVVQPGWHTAHIKNRPHVYSPIYRTQGENYTKHWLNVLKVKPRNVIIASWNDWAEETAIEPATREVAEAELFSDSYGEEVPDYYLKITNGYTQLRRGLINGYYYRSEANINVYQVVNGELILQKDMPHKMPVIVLPDGVLESIMKVPPPQAPPPPSEAPTPTPLPDDICQKSPSVVDRILFMVGIDIYYAFNKKYCKFESFESYKAITGKSDAEGVKCFTNLPSAMEQVENCFVIPKGLFKIKSDLYYSNGLNYCYFPTMEVYTKITGKTDANGVTEYSKIPMTMISDGNCK